MALTNFIKASLQEMFDYLKNPQEDIQISYQPKSIARSYTAAITTLIAISMVLLITAITLRVCCPNIIHKHLVSDVSKAPWWIVTILGPIVEELFTRLALVRKNAFMACSLTIACFYVISCCAFTGKFYTMDFIWARIGVSILAGGALFLVCRKWLTKCNYRAYFYTLAFLFAIGHITRVNFGTLLPFDYLMMMLYLAKQFGMGITFGYVRMKNGIVSSILLHILNNAICF